MNSAIPPACMDRYINRYVGPPHPVQQQQQPPQQHPGHQQQQLLSQNGFYPHQQLLQQQQQQQQHQQLSHGPPPPNFMVGCYSNASGWTGVPLISTAARRPTRKFPPVVPNGPPGSHYQPNGKQPDFDENAMSRLALHAHGAPLILANNNRYNRSSASKPGPNKPSKVPSNHASSRDDHLHHLKMVQAMGHQQQQQQQQMSHPNDAHSVASDESGPNSGTSASSSSSSDTCLPRIIKPRKRRKKDRKPAPQAGSTPADQTPSSTTSSQTPQHPAVNQLLLDETTRDFLHEIALMANAGTFDFSGLIRDQQQQQPVQLPQPPPQQQHLSSSSDSSDSGINNLACSCRLCDPFCKIWAFPLRRSCSDNSAEIELNRAKDVGVIGSNRSNSFRSEWRSSPHSLEQQHHHQPDVNGSSGSRKGSFSDSGDSGCDLLSGLTFCSEDILSSVNRELFLTPVDAGKEFKFPTPGGGGGGGGPNSISGSGSPNNSESPSEMLLISELTKKLNEGLDLRSSGSDSGSSAFSDSSVFGENSSPPSATSDLFVNFDTISRNNLFSVNNISKLSNLLFEDNLTAPGLVINSVHHHNGGQQRLNQSAAPGVNYIRNGVQNPQPPAATEQRPFLFDTDQQRNFDMVWSNNNGNGNNTDRKLLPVEE